MTQTLTTKQLIAIASGEFDACSVLDASVSMARELLANREEQPVAIVESSDYVTAAQITGDEPRRKAVKEMFEGALVIGQHLYTAPPAPAVPNKPRLPPHIYRDLLDMLQEAAIAYGGTQQLRAQLSSALSIHVQPDHPHTRAAMLAQPVSRGDNWKLVPVEPTAEMINAALASGAISIRTAYSAMLAAAPEGGNG